MFSGTPTDVLERMLEHAKQKHSEWAWNLRDSEKAVVRAKESLAHWNKAACDLLAELERRGL
jgi:hypothetical protein